MTAPDLSTQRFVALRDYMHRLSDKLFNAYWQDGLEFFLFRCVNGLEVTRNYCSLGPHEIAELMRLSRAAGGWVVWNDEENRAEFITQSDWIALYTEEFGDLNVQ